MRMRIGLDVAKGSTMIDSSRYMPNTRKWQCGVSSQPIRCIVRRDASADSVSFGMILFLASLFLACAHLSVKTWFPNPAYWLVGAGAIVIAGTWLLVNRRDTFGFLLVMFVCVHFAFADNQGGLWSYVICAVPPFAILLKYHPQIRIASVPKGINVLVLIFLAHQITGLLLNPYSMISNIQSLVVTFAHLVVFYGCASISLSGYRLKRLLTIWFLVALWTFIMAINQKYHWVITPSPLLPQREGRIDMFTSTAAGSFGNSELFSEYFCIVFLISLILIAYGRELALLHIKLIFPLIMMYAAIASLMMGGSRAAILIAAAATGYIVVEYLLLSPSIQSIRRFALIGAIALLGAGFVMEFGSDFSLNETLDDFKKLNLSQMSVFSIVSGDGINRNAVYELGYQRLGEKSWWIGYGFNLAQNNVESMGVSGSGYSDFHSLYLSLPVFYGWAGSVAYVLIVLLSGLRSYLCYLKNRRKNHYLVPVAFAFSFICAVFLIDQYKISVTRNASYFLLSWFWLGWTHSVVNTLKTE